MNRQSRKTADNSKFTIGGISCFFDTFVVKESTVLRMDICPEKPVHRKSANRPTHPRNLIKPIFVPSIR